MLDNRIGILFNASMLRGLTRGRTRHEAIVYYEEAAKRHGVVPVYFRLEDVDVRSLQVTAYIRRHGMYTRKRMTVPTVIHNRAIYFRSDLHAKVRALVNRGIQLFNQVNRYSKLTIHELLQRDPALVPYLPDTVQAAHGTLFKMMERHHSLILKPASGSVGKGIMKLDRTSRGWQAMFSVHTAAKGNRWRTIESLNQALPGLIRTRISRGSYLVQQTLPLATFRGRPFDLRVSVQRDASRNWQITGIVGKVAPSYTFLTNVAQGGTVHTFEEIAANSLPSFPFHRLRQRVSSLSLLIANNLSQQLPHLADLGLDIGLSPDGTPLFIECNGRDQRYSFREANLITEWKLTYENPIAYGASLIYQPQNAPLIN
ncbi:YheC/YheD family protein [Paenibacillus sp. ACRRX]|uniref:YheC/YheD family endospore coat-associated protein n=1 Tax=Paenibacillus sp. ACRRX TaxID=2918206 RepID=UPI001EF4E5B8|nr:YheC/YheD family protein [Paenibacillus sp. ACRRX]MCG7410062.1 YheC/YheD family protein [Paenibacillus sp. ACRRX]